MPVKIAVLAKQVIDPEMPMAAFRVDSAAKVVVTPPNIPPVVNGFDENAVEAALRIKDAQDVTITVISSGTSFALDVMKKPLSMGADDLYLLQDESFTNTIDSFFTAQVLAAAMNIQCFAQIFERHGGTLYMPAWPAFAPGAVPFRLAWLGRFP